MPPKKPPLRSGQPASHSQVSSGEPDQAPGASQDAATGSNDEAPIASEQVTTTTAPAFAAINGAQNAVPTTVPSRGRGGASRAIARPRGIGRRSHNDRAALEKAEQERRQAEAAANARETAWRQRRDAARGRGAMRAKMRGGYAGESERRKDSAQPVSGPFSSGEVSRRGAVVRSGPSTARMGSTARVDYASASAGSSRAKPEGVNVSDVHIKAEDGGYISSEAEDEDIGPKMNIDNLIDLTGEDDEEVAVMPPVRIQRVEHKERNAVPKAVPTKKDKQPADRSDTTTHTSDKRRGKQKAAEVEITREVHRYKGTYTDSESDGETHIKAEPGTEAANGIIDEALHSPPTSPEARRKNKDRIRTSQDGERPSFQTKEEELEWEIRERDLRVLRDELGRLSLPPSATSNGAEQQTADDDPRADKVYLFQLPAILPELVPVVAKSEDADVNMEDVPQADGKAAKKAIVIDEKKPFAAGMVGKLRVHASGKAYLDWGGMPMEISMGQEANFLQDILILDQQQGSTSSMDVDGAKAPSGLALSMGQVKGKFVAVPEWDKIFESAY